MTFASAAPGSMPLRPFLPPPIEALLPDGTLGEHAPDAARSYETGYQAGLAEGWARGEAEGRRAGFEEGLRQGEAAAAEAAERSRRDGVAALNEALEGLAARRAEDRAALETGAREALAAAIRLLAPRLADAALRAELAAMAAEAAAAHGTEAVTLRAHPESLAKLQEGDVPAGLRLMPDTAMRKDTAEASWSGGGALFSAEALAARLIAVLTPPETLPTPIEENPQ